VEVVALGALPAIRSLGVLRRMRFARARRARLRMRLLAARFRVGVGRIARVIPPVVGVRPLGGVWLADRRAQRMVRRRVARDVARILAGRLRKAADRFAWFGLARLFAFGLARRRLLVALVSLGVIHHALTPWSRGRSSDSAKRRNPSWSGPTWWKYTLS